MAFIPKNILITVGHSILKNGTCTSAGGCVNEYLYCKALAPILQEFLLKGGAAKADVVVCPERQFTHSNQERDYKLPIANSGKYDLVVELHLNAFNGSAKGTEVLYYPTSAKSKEVAQRINGKLATVFTNRGIKDRANLYILNSTKPVAVLVEAFFCDNAQDYAKADEPHEMRHIAQLIAEGILDKPIVDKVIHKRYCIVTGGLGAGEVAQAKANQLRGLTGWYLEVEPNPGHDGDYRIRSGWFEGEGYVKSVMNALSILTGWWMTYEEVK